MSDAQPDSPARDDGKRTWRFPRVFWMANGAELFEREPYALAERRGRGPTAGQNVKEKPQRAKEVCFLDEFIQPVLHEYALDGKNSPYRAAPAHISRVSRAGPGGLRPAPRRRAGRVTLA